MLFLVALVVGVGVEGEGSEEFAGVVEDQLAPEKRTPLHRAMS